MNAKRFLVSKKLKIRDPDCPYNSGGEVGVLLTAEQYHRSKRCLCNTCWSRRPTYRSVLRMEWDDAKT